MIVLQHLKLSIEESHNANDGNTKGGGEEHFIEHLVLLASDFGIAQKIKICWRCLKAFKEVITGLPSRHKINNGRHYLK